MGLRRALGVGLAVSACSLAATSAAVASHVPKDGASFVVGTTPTEPLSADYPTLDFHWTQPWSGVTIQALLLPAGPCPGTAAEAFARRYQPSEPPVDHWRSNPLSAARGEPSGVVRWGNLLHLPPGSYVLCGYMYDAQGNPEAPYGSIREWGGHPDVSAAHAFTVRAPSASVSLAVSPRSAPYRSETEKITFTAEWSAESTFAGYGGDDGDGPPMWGADPARELGVMFYPERDLRGGDQCPAGLSVDDVRSRSFLSFARGVGSDDAQAGGLPEETRESPWVASGTQSRRYALYITDYGSILNDLAQSPGAYVLCAYVFRYRDTAVNPAVFPDARSNPVPFTVTGTGSAGSDGSGAPTGPRSAACKRAKTALRKARSNLKKARRKQASRRKVRKLAAKVRTAKKRVKKAC